MMLAGKTAVVTGAGRGIGKGIALALAHEGCRIMALARSRDQVEQTVDAARALGVEAEGRICDVTSRDDVVQVIAACVERFGALDILVNNAGYACFKPFMELSPEEWRETLEVNLTSVFHCCQAAIPHMMQQDYGRIINISSVAGLKPLVNQSAYCASKHGLNGLSKVLAMEMRDYDIAVHAICPGGVDTQLTRDAMPERDKSDWMTPEDIAQAVIFLCKLSKRATVDELVMRRFGSVPIGG